MTMLKRGGPWVFRLMAMAVAGIPLHAQVIAPCLSGAGSVQLSTAPLTSGEISAAATISVSGNFHLNTDAAGNPTPSNSTYVTLVAGSTICLGPGFSAAATASGGGFAAAIGTPLSISSVTLPSATIGSAYSGSNIQWQGGTPPYSLAVLGLPAPLGGSGATSGLTGSINGTPANGTAGQYSVTLQVLDSGNPRQTATRAAAITINPVLSVSPNSWSAPQAGGVSSKLAVTVAAGTTWTTSIPTQSPIPSWLTIQGAGQTGSGTFTLTSAANTTVAVRTAIINVTSGTSTVVIPVIQAGAAITMNPTSASFGAAATTTSTTVAVASAGAAWTAVPSDPWIIVSGITATSFQLNVTADTQPSRAGTVNILSGSVVAGTFAVFQDPPTGGYIREYIRAGGHLVAVENTPPPSSGTGGPPGGGGCGTAGQPLCPPNLSISSATFAEGGSYTLTLTSPYPNTVFSISFNNGWGRLRGYGTTDSNGSWTSAGDAHFSPGTAGRWYETAIMEGHGAGAGVASNTISFQINPGTHTPPPPPYAYLYISPTSTFSDTAPNNSWTLDLETNLPSTSFNFCWNGPTLVGCTENGYGSTGTGGGWSLTNVFNSSVDGTWQEWVIFPQVQSNTITFTVSH